MNSYETFNPDTPDILAVATKYHGNIAQIAKHYGVARETVYQFLKRNPKGKEIIETVREYTTHTLLDCAESVILYNLNRVEHNPGLAQRAAEKVIDGKGHHRGWYPKDKDISITEKNEVDLKKFLEFFQSSAQNTPSNNESTADKSECVTGDNNAPGGSES